MPHELITDGLFVAVLAPVSAPLALALALALARVARGGDDSPHGGAAIAAVEHERLVSRIARRVRSELTLDAVLDVVVAETAAVLGLTRCFVRAGGPGDEMPVIAEWTATGLEPVGSRAAELPVSNLALRLRHAVAVGDVEAATELDEPGLGAREALLALGTRAVLATPIIVFDQVVGVFALHRSEPGDWSSDDVAVAEAVAHEAGMAIHVSKLLVDSERRLRQQRAFHRTASLLARPVTLRETMDAVAEAPLDAFGASCTAVLVRRGEQLELAASRGLRGALASTLAEGLPETDAALVAVTRDRQIVASRDVAVDDRFGEDWREAAGRSGCRSLLAVPVDGAAHEREAGVALVFFADERRFDDDEIELAQHIADVARGALERASLYEEERRARSLAQELARTARLLATELDPAAVLDEVVREAPRLVGGDAGAIRVLDAGELVVSAVAGDDADAALGDRSPATAWLSGDVVQSRTPLALENAAGDERLKAVDALLRGGYVAYVGVPLIGPEGSPLGALSVYSRHAKRWRDAEVEALLALAATASAALANAELYQRVALEKERNDAILANIADGIVAVDRDGRVVLWNRAAEQITGVPATEALGHTPADVLGRQLEAADEGPPLERIVPIARGDGNVWLSVTEAVMRDPAGAVAGRIYAFRDVSAERLVEHMKSEFVSTVSQELRRPLTSIYGFAETLLREDVLFGEHERQTFLRYIASESERLAAIVDQLLNVARLDAGDLQLAVAPTDVRSLAAEVVDSVEGTNQHRFVVDVPDEPLTAVADADKLRQVLANLVDNAIKYSPEGGTVTVAARRRRDRVEVSVADEGRGIAEGERDRIFRKFYRGEGGTARGGGTGLGLFIAQGLVSAMGGRIWVTSREGEGSRFTFELPLARAARRD